MRDAVETILLTADDRNGNVRLESIKVLKDIAEPSLLPNWPILPSMQKSDAELKEASKTLASVAHKFSAEKDAALAILNSIGSAEPLMFDVPFWKLSAASGTTMHSMSCEHL